MGENYRTVNAENLNRSEAGLLEGITSGRKEGLDKFALVTKQVIHGQFPDMAYVAQTKSQTPAEYWQQPASDAPNQQFNQILAPEQQVSGVSAQAANPSAEATSTILDESAEPPAEGYLRSLEEPSPDYWQRDAADESSQQPNHLLDTQPNKAEAESLPTQDQSPQLNVADIRQQVSAALDQNAGANQ
jgi:hypothetical protein